MSDPESERCTAPAPPGVDREAARAWKRRWESVNARELEELRSTPMETKLRQLSCLVAARHLPWGAEDREEEKVRAVWLELKRRFGA